MIGAVRSHRASFDDARVAFDGRTHDSLQIAACCELRSACTLTARNAPHVEDVHLRSVLLGAVATQTAGGASSATAWIVFSARPEGSGAAQLFRIQTTGDGLEQITKGKLSATAPAFSPNGNRIAFTRLGSGLFIMNPDGSGLRRLTSGKRDTYPVWSRDGKRIAFIRPYRREWSLYTMSPTGTKLHRLPQAPPAGRPTWTPDGKAILTAAAGDLIKVDSRTGKVLTYYGMSLDLQTAQSATLSPNRKKVAWVGPRVSTGPDDCGEGPCPQFGLYLANVPSRIQRGASSTTPALQGGRRTARRWSSSTKAR